MRIIWPQSLMEFNEGAGNNALGFFLDSFNLIL